MEHHIYKFAFGMARDESQFFYRLSMNLLRLLLLVFVICLSKRVQVFIEKNALVKTFSSQALPASSAFQDDNECDDDSSSALEGFRRDNNVSSTITPRNESMTWNIAPLQDERNCDEIYLSKTVQSYVSSLKKYGLKSLSSSEMSQLRQEAVGYHFYKMKGHVKVYRRMKIADKTLIPTLIHACVSETTDQITAHGLHLSIDYRITRYRREPHHVMTWIDAIRECLKDARTVLNMLRITQFNDLFLWSHLFRVVRDDEIPLPETHSFVEAQRCTHYLDVQRILPGVMDDD